MEFWIYWLIIIVVLSIIEAMTVSFVSIWYIAGAIVSLVISLFNDDFILQFINFIIIGTMLLLVMRKFLLNNNKIHPKENNQNKNNKKK